jgi:hypothetical protein
MVPLEQKLTSIAFIKKKKDDPLLVGTSPAAAGTLPAAPKTLGEFFNG